MNGAQVRVGIVGAGANTRARHIPGLQAIPGVGIVSLCNRTLESTSKVAREFGIPTLYEHWSELVRARDTDAVVIGTWPYLHCPVTIAALEAGKHVLCEARMAMNAAEARAMRDAARAHPRQVAMLVPAPFTLRVDRTVQRLLADGYLGHLLGVEARIDSGFADPAASLHWREDADLSGMNMMSMGIWYESLLRWVGPATHVMAMGEAAVTTRRDADGILRAIRLPDHLDVIARLAAGGQLHLQVSTVYGLAAPPEIFLFGSEGTLRFTDNRLYAGRRGDAAVQEVIIPPEEEGAWHVEEEFITAIRGQGRVTHTTFDDGVKYMAFTEAVYHSLMRRGEMVVEA